MNNIVKELVEPYYVEIEDLAISSPFLFPFLGGDDVPEGWELLETYYVDALNVAAFAEKIEIGFGYTIANRGQFQVYVGKYRKV